MGNFLPLVATLSSGFSFLFYGTVCLFSQKMVREFERYRLSKYRRLVGFLELGGGLGQLMGVYSEPLSVISSGGLALLMLLGIWTRKRVQDPWHLWLPAIFLFLVNAFLFLLAISA